MIGGYQTTTVPYDEKIVKTYKETYKLSEILFSALFSTKDRFFVLKLERSLMDFVESNVNSYKLNPMNSYCRLLAHNIAEYHGLKHILANDNISVVVFKKFNSSDTPLEKVIGQFPDAHINESNKSEDEDHPTDSIKTISEKLKNSKLDDTDMVNNSSINKKELVRLSDIPVPDNTLLFVAKKFHNQKPNYYQNQPYQMPYQNKGLFANSMPPKSRGNLPVVSLGDPIPETRLEETFFSNESNMNESSCDLQTEAVGPIDLNEESLLEAEKTREEEYNKIMDDIYGESEYEIEPIDDDEGPIIDTKSNNSYLGGNEFNNKGGKYAQHNGRQNGNYGHRNTNYYNNQNRSSPQGSVYKGKQSRQYYTNDYFNNSMNMGAPAFHVLHYNNFAQNGIPTNSPPYIGGYAPISGNEFSKDSYTRQPSNYHEQPFNRHRN